MNPQTKRNQIALNEQEAQLEENKLFVRANLLSMHEDEGGRIAICSAIYQEGPFITEWLIYVNGFLLDISRRVNNISGTGTDGSSAVRQNRLIGVDTFYLYDTGCTDDTLQVLAPWIASGIVKLHQYDQGTLLSESSLKFRHITD